MAIDLFEGSALARETFGPQVVDHYLQYARTELKPSAPGENAVSPGATTVKNALARPARMRDPLEQIAAEL